MRLVFKIAVFFFVLYSIMMIYLIIQYKPITPQVMKSCAVPDDCVRVNANCCGCEQGGEDTCINKDYVDLWEKSLSKECGNTVCIQMYNCPDAGCDCINQTCVFKINE